MSGDLRRLREHRIAHNEALFRAMNEAIEELADRLREVDERRLLGFVCECGHEECLKPMPLTLEEYEAVRSDSVRFVVIPGHEIADFENVVERRAGYLIVAKTGEGATVAARTDARR